MSNYGPPPSDEDEQWIQSVSDAVDSLLKPAPLWQRVLHYPCFVVLAGAQIVRSRWDKFTNRGGK